MYCLFILSCVVAAVSADSTKVHQQMTPEEIRTIFGTSYDSVPEYEVVPVAHAIHEKSYEHRIVQLTSFNRQMTLYLEPTDGYLAGVKTPVYKAKSNPGSTLGVEYKQLPGAIKPKQKFFQDPVNLAAFSIIHDEQDKALIDGIIDELAIRPLPTRFRGQFNRNKRAAQDGFSQSNRSVYYNNLEDTHHHVIYKIPTTVPEPKNSPLRFASLKQLPKPNQVPNYIHPQILLVVEASLFSIFNRDVDSIVTYLLAFWNGVDLRYRVFRNPNVRVNIAGIILAEDHNTTKYLATNHVNVPFYDDIKISVDQALRAKSRDFFPETTFNEKSNTLSMNRLGLDYDMVVTMTPYDMCQFSPSCLDNGEYVCYDSPQGIKNKCITLGLAYYTGACAYNATSAEMESVAIIEDKGGFSGIIPAAHEVGHLLGASHNKANINKCAILDGYIMSYKLQVSRKSFLWSDCSVRSIQRFLKSESRAQCLFNKPAVPGRRVRRMLPGKVFNRDEQCNRLMGTDSCTADKYVASCEKLWCKKPDSTTCVPALHAAVPEGTACQKGNYCINAKCVSETCGSVHLEIGTEKPNIFRS